MSKTSWIVDKTADFWAEAALTLWYPTTQFYIQSEWPYVLPIMFADLQVRHSEEVSC